MSVSGMRLDWTEELHQLVIKNLITSFGLDFLLLEDKKGGDVDTVHNVRQGTYATEQEKKQYDERGSYDSKAYHTHQNYIETGKKHKAEQNDNGHCNSYTGENMNACDSRDLDHVISAKEIHNDPGRILAESSGVELANQSYNLKSTSDAINRSKRDKSIKEYISQLPEKIKTKEGRISVLRNELNNMPQNTLAEKHEYQKRLDSLNKEEISLEKLKKINVNLMLEADQEARNAYNRQINLAYYTSTKFFKNTIISSTNVGFRMGVRESLGLVFAEIWFELKDHLPKVFVKYKNMSVDTSVILSDLEKIILGIFDRVKIRFRELLSTFKDSFIGGLFSSINNTILNIFLTTTKMWGKLIRECWNNIVKIVKLIIFNPDNLNLSDLIKASFKLLSASIGVIVGVIVNTHLSTIMTFPLGNEVGMFFSAIISGVLAVGLNYFIEESDIMKKIWNYLDDIKSKYQRVLDYYNEVNKELDMYLINLSSIEFCFNIEEVDSFSKALTNINDEMERNIFLKKQIENQDILLPFEMGNKKSLEDWALKLCNTHD